jgi:carbonic anhydrase
LPEQNNPGVFAPFWCTEVFVDIPAELAAGYRRFRSDRYVREAERYKTLAKGQGPRTMIIGCADSRVDPASIFSAAPGELFVVRNVAALVPPFEETGQYHGTSAAIEFAVTELKVAQIVVMGHGLCGGIAASLAAAGRAPVGQFLGPWVALLSGVRDQVLARKTLGDQHLQQKALEWAAIKYSLSNLATFPFINGAVAQGLLALHGAWFSIAEGELQWLNRETGEFERIDL